MGRSRSRVAWYAQRLRSMSAPEIGWRSIQLARGLVPDALARRSAHDPWAQLPDQVDLLARFRASEDRPVLLDVERARLIRSTLPEQVEELVEAADRARTGSFQFFGYPSVRLGLPIDWNHDPVSGVHWPLVPARAIDHRSARGDPKWIWELNRLQHLPWLAQAYLFTGREVYAEAALDQLDSWIDQNPVGRGIAWRGAFEAGVRAISVLVALQGVRSSPALTERRFRRAVGMLCAGADLCWRQRSRFSSANNHLIGEMAGLAVTTLLLPELPGSAAWRESALATLATEAGRQILPDGAGAEQAVGYQMFTAELLLVVAALTAATGSGPPAEITEAIRRSSLYLESVVGAHDPDPRYGDDDEGFALRLGPEPIRSVRDHLAITGAWLGHDAASAGVARPLSAAWWSQMKGAATGRTGSGMSRPSSFFAAHGGLVVLRSARRRVTLDVGPLGYLSIAAHGHADALSLTLSQDGRDLVVDPGTASYYGHPAWRRAHRSTAAHATVTVDDQDQSVMQGPFMWGRHAQVRVRSVDVDGGVVDAEHDGYLRLDRPVIHRRWLTASPGGESVLVVDTLEGKGVHRMRVSWPLHPDLDVVANLPRHEAAREGSPALLIDYASVGGAPRLDQVRGGFDSDLGWWSDRLESRVPAWLASAEVDGTAPLVVASLLRPCGTGTTLAPAHLAVERSTDGLHVTWTDTTGDHHVVTPRSPA